MALQISAILETWPIKGAFTIARGSKTEAAVIVAEVADGTHAGRGECVPYPRYGESTQSVLEQIRKVDPSALDRQSLRDSLPPGAARNALDCALWDFEARASGRSVAELCGGAPLKPVTTAFTISLDEPDAMAQAAARAGDYPLLKIKLGGTQDPACLAAVRAAVPRARLIVDANEGWSGDNLMANMRACADKGVELIEQPLAADADAMLGEMDRPVAVCADESVHVSAGLADLADRYDAVNIKLDKAGGLTEALAMTQRARELGFGVMVGCMVATSLAMAPAVILAQKADFVDLDGPLLLARDRTPSLVYQHAVIERIPAGLWG